MIRITKSPNRPTEDYLVLAMILMHGLDSVCHHSCEDCIAKRVCKSVKSATKYAVNCAGMELFYPEEQS